METRLAIACFAARGYIVIAADYIGLGDSDAPNSDLIKDSTTQACGGMLIVTRKIFAEKNIPTSDKLFLSGWSQGTFSTLGFLRQLESIGQPVAAAGFASTASDLYLCVSRWIHVRSELDVQWLLGALALPVRYQQTMNGANTEAVAAGETANHRATFAYRLKQQQEWFAQLPEDESAAIQTTAVTASE